VSLQTFGGEQDGEDIVVVDTSILIKRPAIIKGLLDKFDEVIIPQVVIGELNNQKDDKTRKWLKQRAWLVMCINEVYMFANDVYFLYLVKRKQSDLSLLTYDDYRNQFLGNSKDFFDAKKTQEFMAALKNKGFDKIKRLPYDPEIVKNIYWASGKIIG
jgi:predicted ribonuclease YlaK